MLNKKKIIKFTDLSQYQRNQFYLLKNNLILGIYYIFVSTKSKLYNNELGFFKYYLKFNTRVNSLRCISFVDFFWLHTHLNLRVLLPSELSKLASRDDLSIYDIYKDTTSKYRRQYLLYRLISEGRILDVFYDKKSYYGINKFNNNIKSFWLSYVKVKRKSIISLKISKCDYNYLLKHLKVNTWNAKYCTWEEKLECFKQKYKVPTKLKTIKNTRIKFHKNNEFSTIYDYKNKLKNFGFDLKLLPKASNTWDLNYWKLFFKYNFVWKIINNNKKKISIKAFNVRNKKCGALNNKRQSCSNKVKFGYFCSNHSFYNIFPILTKIFVLQLPKNSNLKQCKGITLNNKRCLNIATRGKYCMRHRHLNFFYVKHN